MKKLVFVMLMLLLPGCTQNLKSHDLARTETVPAISYEAYFYTAGMSERSRAVFLKHPDAEIMIEPASPEIMSTTATYSEAMTFMQMKRGMRSVTTEVIMYKDKPLGYLLTYNRPGINGEYVVPNLYERGGKIYFSARENTRAED